MEWNISSTSNLQIKLGAVYKQMSVNLRSKTFYLLLELSLHCYAKYTATLFRIDEIDIQRIVHPDIFL